MSGKKSRRKIQIEQFCVDWRTHQKMDQIKKSAEQKRAVTVVYVRTPMASVKAARNTIKKLLKGEMGEVVAWNIHGHTDCKAAEATSEKKNVSEAFEDDVAWPARKEGFKGRDDLEKVANPKAQEKEARLLLLGSGSKVDIGTDVIPVEQMLPYKETDSELGFSVLIIKPSDLDNDSLLKYLALKSYAVFMPQVDEIEEAFSTIDLLLAEEVPVKEIYLGVLPSEHGGSFSEEDLSKLQERYPDINMTLRKAPN